MDDLVGDASKIIVVLVVRQTHRWERCFVSTGPGFPCAGLADVPFWQRFFVTIASVGVCVSVTPHGSPGLLTAAVLRPVHQKTDDAKAFLRLRRLLNNGRIAEQLNAGALFMVMNHRRVQNVSIFDPRPNIDFGLPAPVLNHRGERNGHVLALTRRLWAEHGGSSAAQLPERWFSILGHRECLIVYPRPHVRCWSRADIFPFYPENILLNSSAKSVGCDVEPLAENKGALGSCGNIGTLSRGLGSNPRRFIGTEKEPALDRRDNEQQPCENGEDKSVERDRIGRRPLPNGFGRFLLGAGAFGIARGACGFWLLCGRLR